MPTTNKNKEFIIRLISKITVFGLLLVFTDLALANALENEAQAWGQKFWSFARAATSVGLGLSVSVWVLGDADTGSYWFKKVAIGCGIAFLEVPIRSFFGS